MQSVTGNRRPTDAEAQAIWERYRRTGDLRHRNRLVVMYTGMVKYLAFKKAQELPTRCELDDLVSCGLVALIQAIERFDPAKGATLEQLAWIRVQGAILDELRRQDWAPRSVRRGERRLNAAADRFAARNGRRPDDRELADEAGLAHEDLKELYGDISRAHVGSLNAPAWRGDEDRTETIEILEDFGDEGQPEAAVLRADAHERLRAAVGRLPERERQVAELLYERGLNQREAGEALNLTESRISQIHTKLRNGLRLALADERECFDATA